MKTLNILSKTALTAYVLLSLICSASAASVAASRDMPSYVSPGTNFTVTISLKFNGSVLGCGVTEYFPSGWIVSDLSNGNLRTSPDRIEWILFTGSPLTDRAVSYRVTVPDSASGAFYFTGNVTSTGAGNGSIAGKGLIEIGPYLLNAARHLPSTAYTNSAYTVRISLDVDESNKPAALALTEYVPAGLNVSSVSTGGVYLPDTRRIEWLLSGLTTPVADTNLTYLVDIPASASTGSVSFDGVVQISGSSNRSVGGDTALTIAQGCSARGDVPPCNVVRVSEVLNVIQEWAGGNASINDVLSLIILWANSL